MIRHAPHKQQQSGMVNGLAPVDIPRNVLRHLTIGQGVFIGSRVLYAGPHAEQWSAWLGRLGVVTTGITMDCLQSQPLQPDGNSVAESRDEVDAKPSLQHDEPMQADWQETLFDAVIMAASTRAGANSKAWAKTSEIEPLFERAQRRVRVGGKLLLLEHRADAQFGTFDEDLSQMPGWQMRRFVTPRWSHWFGHVGGEFRILSTRCRHRIRSRQSRDSRPQTSINDSNERAA